MRNAVRQKQSTTVSLEEEIYQEMRVLGLTTGNCFFIEEMFGDFKSGGDNLEGYKLSVEYLPKLLIIVAIAYTRATLQGHKIKQS